MPAPPRVLYIVRLPAIILSEGRYCAKLVSRLQKSCHVEMAFSIEADDAPPIQDGIPSLVDTPGSEAILESVVHDRFDVIVFAPGVMLTEGRESRPPRFRARAEFIRRFTARGGVVVTLESNAAHFATLTTRYNEFLADARIPGTHTCGYEIPNAARLVDQRTGNSPKGWAVLGDDFLPRSGFARDATAGIERLTMLDAVCLDCSGPNRPLIVLGSPHAGLVTGADLPVYDMLPVPAAYNALGGGVRINFAAWMLDCDEFDAEELDTNLRLIEQTIHAAVKWYGPCRRPPRR